MYNLSIGGHEIFLVVQVFALAFALLPPVRNAVLDRRLSVRRSTGTWHTAMLLLSFLSIATWWIPEPLTRLVLTGLANFASAISHALFWGKAWQQSSSAMLRTVTVWLAGLLLSALAKYVCHSNNPLWPFMKASTGGQHPTGLALAALCVLEFLLRPEPETQISVTVRRRAPQTLTSEAQAALGMGSLLFAVSGSFDRVLSVASRLTLKCSFLQLHTFLTDSGTMIAWTWTGYPVRG